MKILVTGACGYKGAVLIPKLLAYKGARVTALDTMWFGDGGLTKLAAAHENGQLQVMQADVRDFGSIFFHNKFDVVIHLASIANDPCANLNPALTWDVIAGGTQRLADAAARAGVKHFIYASSASVYGISDRDRVDEGTPCVPLTVYNQAKLVAERALMSYQGLGMWTSIIRPATVCGLSPAMRSDVVVNLLTMQALNRGKITVLGGDQHRPNIHIEDITDLYVWLLDRPMNCSLNAGAENLTVKQIAQLVAQRTGADVEYRDSNDARSYRLDSGLLAAAGWKPTRTVADAIDDIVHAHNRGELIDRDEMSRVNWMRQEGVK